MYGCFLFIAVASLFAFTARELGGGGGLRACAAFFAESSTSAYLCPFQLVIYRRMLGAFVRAEKGEG
jgi:hypothetical protein